MPTMTSLLRSIPTLTLTSALDVIIVAFLIYQFLLIVRGRRAAHILIGLTLLGVLYSAAAWFRLVLLESLLSQLAPYVPFTIIVVFQSEIRRLLSRLGRRRFMTLGGRLQRRELPDELVLVFRELAESKTGALVVLECDIGLRTFIESGVMLDANLSRELLLTIFQRGSALHDGAVIIKSDRVAAAACFLPLSVKPFLNRKLGTRHRAAIGVTEETDCLALVVSEESGAISAVAFGDIELNITPERLEQRIREHVIDKRFQRSYRGIALPGTEPSISEQSRGRASL